MICKLCKIEKSVDQYYWCTAFGKNDKVYKFPSKTCKSCVIKKTKNYAKNNNAKIILWNARKGDKKRNQEFNLTIQDVEEIIKQSCVYCGSTAHIAPDRIDNSKGHTKDNVLPACLWCNSFRTNMPYEAWIQLFPIVQQARRLGLFGDWIRHSK